MELSQHEFMRARRYNQPLAAIMIDIDHFKQVNDTYGHAAGDEVLRTVAWRCKKAVRQIDILGRYGGEEFTTLVLNADLQGVLIVAERLRRCIAETPIDSSQGPIQITISLGVVILDQDCKNLDDLLHRADQALYAAKQAGRNQVSIWHA
jgi:diguanylate cyclase (GGDEF)-like protein